ncbi:MAG: hypothetical protein PVG97_03625, partial [Syntrophobacterales bacterium]
MLVQRLRVLLAILLFLSLTLSTTTYGQNDKGPEPTVEEKKEPPVATSVAEIVPLATKLAERSAALENELAKVFNFSEAEERFEQIANETAKLSEQLQALKSSKNYGYDQLAELRGALNRQDDSLEKIIRALAEAINETDFWKEEWSKESQKWKELRSS